MCCSTIHGRIDQVNQILDLDKEEQGGARLVILILLFWCYFLCIDILHWKHGAVKSTLYMPLLLDESFKSCCKSVNHLNSKKVISVMCVGDVAQR